MTRKIPWPALILFGLAITLPYVFGYLSGGGDSVFGGFLLNPQDGNSYLAKMQQGYQGQWQFTLSFSIQQGEGAYLFLYYLFLGHVARWFGLSLLLVYHAARMVGAVVMVIGLTTFTQWLFPRSPKEARQSLLLSVFGSGMGWTLLLTGLVTSDLWVAEAYPFLSAYATPHFSLGMGLLVWILSGLTRPVTVRHMVELAVCGFVLSVVMPFGVVVAGSIGLAWSISEWAVRKRVDLRAIISAFLFGGPFLLYQYGSVLQDTALAQWNQQNLTQSPPVWDLAIATLPALILAGIGIFKIIRDDWKDPAFRLLVIWFVVGIFLIYFPFDLQRRFMFGFYIPVGCLAIVGLRALPGGYSIRKNGIFAAILTVSVVSNVVVIFVGLFGVLQRSPIYYYSRDEAAAFQFLANERKQDEVVLCAPETGMFLPGHTGQRVVFGHDFETIDALTTKQTVLDLYQNHVSLTDAAAFLRENEIGYIFNGPREKALGSAQFLIGLNRVYQNETVEIYSR